MEGKAMKLKSLNKRQRMIASIIRTSRLKGVTRFESIEKLSGDKISHRYLKTLCSQVDSVIDTLSMLGMMKENFEAELTLEFLSITTFKEEDLL